jgi:NAD kinase
VRILLGYLLLISGVLGGSLGAYSMRKGIKEAEQTLRNEVEGIPVNERLRFLKDQIKEIEEIRYKLFSSVFHSLNEATLSKVAREYLNESEYVDFLRDLHPKMFS